MGIQINGQTDIITASDGQLTLSGVDVNNGSVEVTAIEATVVNVGSAVTIHSGGLQVGPTDLHSTGLTVQNIDVTGVVTATSFSGDGSNITGISTNYYKGEIVGFDNVIDSDIDITTDYRTAIIYVDQDLTVDIEEGATITIDDGCFLNIIS